MDFPEPEYHSLEEFNNRSQKLTELRELGIDPYPHTFTPKSTAHELAQFYEGKEVGHSEDAASGATAHTSVAGRLVLFRAMGKNAFGQIQDDTGRIQIMFNKDATKLVGYTGEAPLKLIEKKIDLGDIIGVEGNLFRTQKGELTLFVKQATLLCKTLLPLPDKYAGLVDKGIRYKKRWLDLISNEEVMRTFQLRSKILRIIRAYFEQHHFMEVETPILQNIYGGAEARPFTTNLNALDQEMYLRIALEISLKKLIVGGFSRVYEIGKIFRNEGIDKTHNPEFTMLEAYMAYADYNDMMTLTENLFEKIALELFGTTQIHNIDLKTPWKRLSMKESIRIYGQIDVDNTSEQAMRALLLDRGAGSHEELAKMVRGDLIAALFEELVEPHLIEPHHIIDHPIETTPLCKLHRDPTHQADRIVERFETFILGNEFCNSYTELNDPQLQRELLLDQAKKRLAGDKEAHPLDEDFIEAICQGMPPTGGVGIGIDRLVMLFTAAPSIRDILFFPILSTE